MHKFKFFCKYNNLNLNAKIYDAYYRLDPDTKTLVNFFLVNQDSARIKKFIADIMIGYNTGNRNFIKKIRNNPQNYTFSEKTANSNILIDKPTLFINAKQDILVGYLDAKALSNFFSNKTFIIIDSAGHAVQIAQQQRFEFEMIKFLNSL